MNLQAQRTLWPVCGGREWQSRLPLAIVVSGQGPVVIRGRIIDFGGIGCASFVGTAPLSIGLCRDSLDHCESRENSDR